MPELPGILLYLRALEQRLLGERIESISVRSPSLLRTYSPQLESVVQQRITAISRSGKRILWTLDSGICLVFHLMIAGQLLPTLPNRRQNPRGSLAQSTAQRRLAEVAR
ncbi:MAG: DNA-formamidopyrimidine glycosylase family protein [Pirellulaceae bacterium]|nr:DNA-formamidopyrimidine glycosylase family protein [Pirellulaceae bacterium]